MAECEIQASEMWTCQLAILTVNDIKQANEPNIYYRIVNHFDCFEAGRYDDAWNNSFSNVIGQKITPNVSH